MVSGGSDVSRAQEQQPQVTRNFYSESVNEAEDPIEVDRVQPTEAPAESLTECPTESPHVYNIVSPTESPAESPRVYNIASPTKSTAESPRVYNISSPTVNQAKSQSTRPRVKAFTKLRAQPRAHVYMILSA